MKNKRVIFLLLFIVIISLIFTVGCADNKELQESNEGANGRVTIISGTEAQQLMNSDENALMLDVRSPDEFNSGHVEGAMHIPVDELETRLNELPDKYTTIIIYCRGGVRSARAVEILVENGYINVYDMQMFENWPG